MNDHDDHHQRCLEFLASGTRAELAFLADIRAGLFTLLETASADPLGAVDASVIALTERLNLPAVATVDHRHFRIVRPRHIAALTLLP